MKKRRKKKRRKKQEEYHSLQTRPTWKHKTLSWIDSILWTWCTLYPMGSPWKGAVSTRGETIATELNPESSDFVFDHQQDAFRTWHSDDLTRDNVSAKKKKEKKHTNILVFISCIGWNSHLVRVLHRGSEPLMCSPSAKRVWLAVKNKSGPFQVQFFLYESHIWLKRSLSGGFPYDRHCKKTTTKKNKNKEGWIGSGEGLMLPSRVG